MDTRPNGKNTLRKVTRIAGSSYISIPMDATRQHQIENGTMYEFQWDNGKLVFTPVNE